MRRPKLPRALLLLAPMLVFWALTWLGLRAGIEAPAWRRESAQLWQNSRWEQLNALAENLDRLGLPDSETSCLAAIAASRLQQPDRVQAHASRFLAGRALDWKCETRLAAIYPATAPIERLRLFRTRLTFALLAVLGALNLLSFFSRRDLLPFSAAVSLLGCLLLLL